MSEGVRRLVTRKLSEMLRQAEARRKADSRKAGPMSAEASPETITGNGAGQGRGKDHAQVNDVCQTQELDKVALTASLRENVSAFRQVFGNYPGFIIREFLVAEQVRAAAVFIEGLVDRQLVSASILKPLMGPGHNPPRLKGQGGLLERVRLTVATVAPVRERSNLGETARDIMKGAVVVLLDGEARALSFEVTGFPTRSIEEPVSESVVRGPREGFTESLAQNLTLVQRRLKTPNLAVENHFLGRETHTQVAVLYLKGLVNPEHLKELRSRLKRIDHNVDGILESTCIEEMIADSPLSPFPQALNTERPDRVAAHLLEGRIALLIENTPFALVVPFGFIAQMQAAEDFYQKYWFASAVRILRYIALAIALTGPAVYVAVTTFHQEMIPERLLFQVVAARQGVPFPAVFEILLLDYAFEILREAGIRLPRPVGQAVSIVGALVIGQAAIQAGLTSPLAVIMVAITGIASFALPTFALAFTFRLIRFPLTILGGVLGLYGVVAGVMAILIHLAELRTLGVPYLAGFAPLHLSDLADSVVSYPWWAMHRRPAELAKRNPVRETPDLKPGPDE